MKAILSSAMRGGKDRIEDESSFYSNGLDAIDNLVISNRQRLNDTHTPAMLEDATMGRHLASGAHHKGGDHAASSSSF